MGSGQDLVGGSARGAPWLVLGAVCAGQRSSAQFSFTSVCVQVQPQKGMRAALLSVPCCALWWWQVVELLESPAVLSCRCVAQVELLTQHTAHAQHIGCLQASGVSRSSYSRPTRGACLLFIHMMHTRPWWLHCVLH
jgi:hypothetical protein